MSAVVRTIKAARRLSQQAAELRFALPVTHVYNPLIYAWPAHQAYLRLANPGGTRVLLLGMNPGPWGMAQTGVPFGQVPAVRDWMGIDAAIGRPATEHPKRPIQGLACPRSEVSGERLWGLMRDRFKTADAFFAEHFVLNYCPLVFMEESGRNRTPDKLGAAERAALGEVCDEHLRAAIAAMKPEFLVGVGRYAEASLRRVAPQHPRVSAILHPSPASPAANRGWAKAATGQLIEAGVW